MTTVTHRLFGNLLKKPLLSFWQAFWELVKKAFIKFLAGFLLKSLY